MTLRHPFLFLRCAGEVWDEEQLTCGHRSSNRGSTPWQQRCSLSGPIKQVPDTLPTHHPKDWPTCTAIVSMFYEISPSHCFRDGGVYSDEHLHLIFVINPLPGGSWTHVHCQWSSLQVYHTVEDTLISGTLITIQQSSEAKLLHQPIPYSDQSRTMHSNFCIFTWDKALTCPCPLFDKDIV